MVNEGRHDNSLLTMQRNSEKQRSGFGEMKQKERPRCSGCLMLRQWLHCNNGEGKL